jgi:hypothetical protein
MTDNSHNIIENPLRQVDKIAFIQLQIGVDLGLHVRSAKPTTIESDNVTTEICQRTLAFHAVSGHTKYFPS